MKRNFLFCLSLALNIFLLSACGAGMGGNALTEGATHAVEPAGSNVTAPPHFENDAPGGAANQGTAPAMPVGIAATGTNFAAAPVPGVQSTDSGVPVGLVKASLIRVHVAELSGKADASTNEASPGDPCLDPSGQILPNLFSSGERPYVFFQDSANAGSSSMGPFGIQTDDCGRHYFTWVPSAQDNYNPLDPTRDGCKGSAEIWATLKTPVGQNLESDHQSITCTVEGGIFQITLQFPPTEETALPRSRTLPVLMRKAF